MTRRPGVDRGPITLSDTNGDCCHNRVVAAVILDVTERQLLQLPIEHLTVGGVKLWRCRDLEQYAARRTRLVEQDQTAGGLR